MKAWAFLPLLVALTTVSASSSLPPIEGRGNGKPPEFAFRPLLTSDDSILGR